MKLSMFALAFVSSLMMPEQTAAQSQLEGWDPNWGIGARGGTLGTISAAVAVMGGDETADNNVRIAVANDAPLPSTGGPAAAAKEEDDDEIVTITMTMYTTVTLTTSATATPAP